MKFSQNSGDSFVHNPKTPKCPRDAGEFFPLPQPKKLTKIHGWFWPNLESPNATTFLGGAFKRNKWGSGNGETPKFEIIWKGVGPTALFSRVLALPHCVWKFEDELLLSKKSHVWRTFFVWKKWTFSNYSTFNFWSALMKFCFVPDFVLLAIFEREVSPAAFDGDRKHWNESFWDFSRYRRVLKHVPTSRL